MNREFEVIKVVIHHNRGLFVFARHLGTNHDFQVPEGSILGDLPIYNYDEMKSLKDERPDIFVFRPIAIERMFDQQFKEGEKVTLTTLD
jgi:hypothetical protein